MLMSPARFDTMLKQMGQTVSWRRAAPCPCRNPTSGQATYGCPICSGLATVWGDAIAAWTGLSGMRVAREYAAFGRWESGDVILTIPGDSPLWSAGEHDRVVLTQSSEPFQQILTRGEAERVPNGIVRAVDRCFWLRPDGAAMIEGTPPAVDATGAVIWSDGDTQPDAGVQYTLVGRRSPEFFLFGDLPQDRSHFGGLPLPRRVAARRFDLWGQIGAAT